jgi:hypothetical protein
MPSPTVGVTIALLWMQEKGLHIEIWGQQRDQQNVVGTLELIRTRTVKLKQSAMEETEETYEYFMLR